MQKQIEIQNVVEQLTEEQKSRYSKFEKRLDEINKKLEQ
jgi:tetrahydromethanopterin S-methyltransferase subunit G